MKTFRLSAAICLSFLALPMATAQDAPRATSFSGNPVFQKNCAKCHGKTGEGRHFGGPSLISEKTTDTPADELRNIVTNGKGRMPKFGAKLTSEEIDMLVQQIKAQAKK